MIIGDHIRSRLTEQDKTVAWLATQLVCSRTNVYKIFAKDHLDTELLMRLSVILNYDFFKLFSKALNERKGLK